MSSRSGKAKKNHVKALRYAYPELGLTGISVFDVNTFSVARCRTALAQRAFFLRSRSKILELFKQVHQSNYFAPGFQKNYYEGRIFLTLSFTYIFISILKSIHSL